LKLNIDSRTIAVVPPIRQQATGRRYQDD